MRGFWEEDFSRSRFCDDGVSVFVGGGAAAEEGEGLVAEVPDFVFLAGRDGDGVIYFYFAGFVFDADFAVAGGDVVDFLGFGMVVFLGAAANGDAGFGEALV